MIFIERVHTINPEIMQAIQRLYPQLTHYSPPPDEKEIVDLVNSSASSLWVARNADREIVGMASLGIYRTATGVHAWIEDVVVDQKARRKGVGSALTSAACDFAQESGAKAVSLTSRSDRKAANLLYQNLGFNKVDTNLYRKQLN